MLGTKVNLIKILSDDGRFSPEELEKAFSLQKKSNKSLKHILVEEKFLSEDELLALIAYYLFIPMLDPARFKINPAIAEFIPEELARKYHIFTLSLAKDGLLVATDDPLDIVTLDSLSISIGCPIKQVLAREKSVLECIDRIYSPLESLPEILKFDKELEIVSVREAEESGSFELIQESQKQPVVQAVDLVINEAIQKRASDIHIEPTEDELLVRCRIDGIMHQVHVLPKKSQKGIAARIKILSDMDITKFYLPQDGRFSIKTQGKDIDFRVSSLPTIHGEKFVLRILDKASIFVKLDELGFSQASYGLVKEAINKNQGMVLITGPTGSGKSTTLYSILNELNNVQRHIMTVEDPVEYQLDGITQAQVKPEIELTFSAALRGILRQSPDTIMVGEIRDAETADIAIKASLIGQLIFSTLHTNDATSAFVRLIDMGVERYLVASALVLVCAQRLCRKICPHCKEKLDKPPIEFTKELEAQFKEKPVFYAGSGCSYCQQKGYLGRAALLEALRVDDAIKSMIIKGVSVEEIKNFSQREGRLITLRQDGLSKVLAGVTTLEEVMRVTARD